MQMARKVGVKIILQNSCHKLILFSPNKSACKNKTIQSHFPHIQFIPFPTLTPTHCIHIVNVDISETKWSASKVWGDTHSQSRPRLNSPSPVSHPQSPSHPRAQHTSASAPGLNLRLRLSDQSLNL